MSSAGHRERVLYAIEKVGNEIPITTWSHNGGIVPSLPDVRSAIGTQYTESESHAIDRKTGSYHAGGPFYTSLERRYNKPLFLKDHYYQSNGTVYSGPCGIGGPTLAEREKLGAPTTSYGDRNTSSMESDGTTAIAQSAPVNPASNLGTSLAESFREGIPSLPGIELWKSKTEFLKGLGSEYLNYQFGWAPLKDEVQSVRDAARNHRDLLMQYHRGEGSDTHRTFRFPSQSSITSLGLQTSGFSWQNAPGVGTGGTRQVFMEAKTERWFEGVFTYGLPSSTDSWRKALGYGSDADALFGISLTPSVLWELTPWSWAVDWFSNAGDVITNVTNFGLAGLVMRYGYMMEESIVNIFAEGHTPSMASVRLLKPGEAEIVKNGIKPGRALSGIEFVTKRRIPASPFGFSIGWEDLSPTQLAITAALGITRVL